MKAIRELLQEEDPLRREPEPSSDQRHFRRQAILKTASGAPSLVRPESRSRLSVFVAAALMVIAASLVGVLIWSLSIRELQAAMRFEVRLAEDRPAPGLREAKASGSDRSIYLHEEFVVTNRDIAAARVVQGAGPSQYWVSVEFTAPGAEKMRSATQNHIGKPVAILLDGQVIVAPVLRTPIEAAAMISGNYTKAQAERIVKGIGIK